MKIHKFTSGDPITLNTGFPCDKGTFIRYDNDHIIWTGILGGRYRTPIEQYNITLDPIVNKQRK